MDSNWKEELARLKAIIASTGLTETKKWGIPVFTYNGKNLIGIAGFKSHFALWFYNGSFLRDEKKVLINASEGKTKALRQWRFHAMEEIDELGIIAYIQEAIENENQGKKLIPQQKEQLPIPPQLQAVFEDDEALAENFFVLSPPKQQDYLEHIHAAKQEKPTLSRLQTMRPALMQDRGRHDKYKK